MTAPPRASFAANDQCESDRLAALHRFDVLDSPREEAFDRITRLIRRIFDVPIGIVSMFDGHRQWFKSIDGVAATEMPRDDSFCRLPLVTGAPLVVPDMTLDPRFADHPNVTGGQRVRFYAGVPLKTVEGLTIGTICAIDFAPRSFTARDTEILEDLSRIAMSELELRQRASVDVLTGSLTRRAFKEEGTRSVALAQRHRHPLSVVALDLDHFKSVNDRFGHAGGDRVLADVIRTCAGHLRQSDLIGRLGGEEFAMLLPHTDLHHAFDVAEKLRSSIAKLRFDFGGVAEGVTASFGVATVSAGAADIDTLLEHADKALYLAKNGGRNRSVMFDDPTLVAAVPAIDQPARPAPRRVLKAAQIVFNDAHSTIDCTVRTLATDRAGIDVSTSFGIPPRFTLAIRADNFATGCRVVRQTEKHLEVEFCEAA